MQAPNLAPLPADLHGRSPASQDNSRREYFANANVDVHTQAEFPWGIAFVLLLTSA